MSPTSPRSALPTAIDRPGAPGPRHEMAGDRGAAPPQRETGAMALTALGLCCRALLKIGAGPSPASTRAPPRRRSPPISTAPPATRCSRPIPGASPPPRRRCRCWPTRRWRDSTTPMPAAGRFPAGAVRRIARPWPGAGLPHRRRTLQTDAEQVTLTYVFRPAESAFPPFFDQVRGRAAGGGVLPAADREQQPRGGSVRSWPRWSSAGARLIDSQQDTPRGIEDFPLIEARG